MISTLRSLFSGSSVTLVGLVLIAIALWWYGPYLGFGSWYPLQGVLSRLVLILLIFLAWGGTQLVRRLQANKKDKQLAEDLAEPTEADRAATASSEELQLLQQRFEEAVSTLKDSSGKKGKASLYELPWYVIIGPPGSGKTTALVNSGLEFPLEQRFGKEALRGVGGTRNCDWWFTNEAVLLDTAGRYVTQDSHQAVDSVAWTGFLDLLKKYRKRRPINGVLVAMSLSDLMTQSEQERNAHVMAIRQRVQELYQHFGIKFPVYMVFTKCDLVAGFIEYFDELDQAGREQVWGVTFPFHDGSQSAENINSLGSHLQALLDRLSQRLGWRLNQERDLSRRAKIYNFPQQITALSDTISSFVSDIFSASRYDESILLRGVYFTSGVQEGTPIDRMMSVMARTFGVAEQSLSSFGGRGRSYFITDLFREILFKESGLAGVNPKIEKRRRLLQAGAYVTAIAVAVLMTIAWITSFNANRNYLDEVGVALQEYQQMPEPQSGQTQRLDDVLPRLDSLRRVVDVAQQHQEETPLHMRMWLFQGDSMSDRVGEAYLRELNKYLGPVVMKLLEQRIRENAANPQLLYEYLKAYIMLGNPERMDPRQLSFLINAEWRRSYQGDGDKYTRLKNHSDFLFQQPMPFPVNERLISGAQATLAQSPLSEFLYSRLRLDALNYENQDLVLTQRIGLGLEKVFRRSSGVPLSENISVLYTKDGFTKLYPLLSSKLISEAGKENWVLGRDDTAISASEVAELESELRARYTRDYIATWQNLLNDLETVPFSSEAQVMEVLDLIAAKPSVMHELLLIVAENTNLSTPPDAEGEGDGDSGGSRLSRLFGDAGGAPQLAIASPGDPITREFARLNRLVTSEPAAIELLLPLVDNLQQEVDEASASGDMVAAMSRGGGPAARRIRTEARRQPEPVRSWLTALGGGSQAVAANNAKQQLAQEYGDTVVGACRRFVDGRYPFNRSSEEDVAIDDFGRVFGDGGVFHSFFDKHLAPIVDRSGTTWKVRDGSPIRLSRALLQQFQTAEMIREVYFPAGGSKPEVDLTFTTTRLDAEVRRFTLDAGGTPLVYQHGPEQAFPVRWPQPGAGGVRVLFEESSGGRPTVVEDGPWALFRLFESSDIRPLSDTHYEMDVSAGSRSATIRIETRSVTNLFSGPKLYEFQCLKSL